MQPKVKSKSASLRLHTEKQELQPEIDNENISKTRDSRYVRQSRHTKQSKFLSKTEGDDFQIRKALNFYIREELVQQGRKTYFQRVFILARNIELEKLTENDKDSFCHTFNAKQYDFRDYFQKIFDKIFRTCEKKKCTNDQLSGLFICMDTHTYLMIEGAEDMLADFFEELALIHDSLWTESKVFLVEDKIGQTYFNSFNTRRSPAININEKFPNATSSDFDLMSVQHFKIMGKVKKLAESLASQLFETENQKHELDKGDMKDPFTLPADPFNKLLPEIQRIDLVLNANKFYLNIKDFALTYRNIPTHQDEDALFWPIQNNYTPLDIFKRSTFDVNLTFGDYCTDEKNNNENGSHD